MSFSTGARLALSSAGPSAHRRAERAARQLGVATGLPPEPEPAPGPPPAEAEDAGLFWRWIAAGSAAVFGVAALVLWLDVESTYDLFDTLGVE